MTLIVIIPDHLPLHNQEEENQDWTEAPDHLVALQALIELSNHLQTSDTHIIKSSYHVTVTGMSTAYTTGISTAHATEISTAHATGMSTIRVTNKLITLVMAVIVFHLKAVINQNT